MALRAWVMVAMVVGAGCASAGGSGGRTAAPAAVSAVSAATESIRWVRESAEYEAALHQVYRQLTAHVEVEAATRDRGSWAVVLDADETVIGNAQYQVERARLGLGFTPESWTAWVRRQEATELPGARGFLIRVRELGGKIAIVTNRRESECDDTTAVFEKHSLPFDAILCRPDAGPSDKNPRFDAVAEGMSPASDRPLEVIAFVGDNIHDFPALSQQVREHGPAGYELFGERYFLVPNPMYGSWQ